ncbi:MAG: TorF family putative porin [Rhodocyclaceae bacterium]|nr:TorF family putative porin [Rhodocyclaceae bacterium]
MQKKLLGLAVATIVASPLAAIADEAPAPTSPWAFTVGAVSDYLFRGVSQTHGKPAVQGGVTYTDPSGFYANLWGSNITWVKDALGKGSTEVDISAGYKNSFGGSKLGYDVGYYTYNYPGYGSTNVAAVPNPASFIANPNTQELYGALNYDLGNNNSLQAKYSYTTSKYFIGWYNTDTAQNTKGSGYLEFNGTFDLGNGWGVTAHAGHQSVANWSFANYSDVNIGVTKDVGFGTVGFLVSTTNVKDGGCDMITNAVSAGKVSPYCWGNSGATSTNGGPTGGYKNVAKSTAVLSFNKTF